MTDENYINAWTTYEGSVRLLKKDKKLTIINDLMPYFWMRKSDWTTYGTEIPSPVSRCFIKTEELDQWIKIYYKYPNQKYLLDYFSHEGRFKTYELDLRPHELWMINNEFQIEEEYNVLYFDIETKDTEGDVVVGRDRIISFSAIDSKGNTFIFSEDDEKSMLVKAGNLMKKYDIIAGYNSAKFDLPYLKERFKMNFIIFDWNSVQHLDILKLLKSNQFLRRRMSELGVISWSLDSMSKTFLKENKFKLTDSDEGYGGRLWALFNTDREKLKQYNLQDSVLIKKLDENFALITMQIEICKLAKVFLQRSMQISHVVDFLILREGAKRNVHFRTVFPFQDTGHEKYAGGYVFESISGLHTNVCIFDFSGLYPNIIRTFNLSPETIAEDDDTDPIILPSGTKITRKFRGILPSLLDNLQDLRYKYKDEKVKMGEQFGKNSPEFNLAAVKELAVKVIVLSMYGVMGASFTRFFDVRIAEGITLTGQHLIKDVSNYLKICEYETLGGDTDAIFLKVENLDNVIKNKKVQNLIQNHLDELILKEFKIENKFLKMELEKVADNMIILTKKRYTMHVVNENEKPVSYIYSRGVENARGDFTQIGKRFFDEIAKAILIHKKEPHELDEIVERYKKQILSGQVTAEDILITQEISKMYHEYKTIPAHVQLAKDRLDKKLDRYYISQKIPFIIVSSKPMKVIHFRDFVEGKFDKEYYWTNKIYPSIQRLLEISHPHHNWEIAKDTDPGKQSTLGTYL